MNTNDYGFVSLRIYRAEPGDGTRYVFGLLDSDGLEPGQHFLPAARPGYVLIVPISPPGKPYPFDKHALQNPYRALAWYMREKTGLDEHACAAIILAASWLVLYPEYLRPAVQRMLLARQLLDGGDIAEALQAAALPSGVLQVEVPSAAV
jgi:hypothetical protein